MIQRSNEARKYKHPNTCTQTTLANNIVYSTIWQLKAYDTDTFRNPLIVKRFWWLSVDYEANKSRIWALWFIYQLWWWFNHRLKPVNANSPTRAHTHYTCQQYGSLYDDAVHLSLTKALAAQFQTEHVRVWGVFCDFLVNNFNFLSLRAWKIAFNIEIMLETCLAISNYPWHTISWS